MSLESRVGVEQVEVQGVEGPLKEEAEATLTIRPNFAYTVKEVKDNMQSIFDIGAFAETTCDAHDTRDGVKLVFKVGELASTLFCSGPVLAFML